MADEPHEFVKKRMSFYLYPFSVYMLLNCNIVSSAALLLVSVLAEYLKVKLYWRPYPMTTSPP